MSLTQERINEIILKSFDELQISIRPKDAIAACNLSISSIRKEQEAFAFAANDCADGYILCHTELQAEKEACGIDARVFPLFTIPPASPDCKELVESAIKLKAYLESQACMIAGFDIPDEIYIPFSDSLAKHKASMGD